MFKKARIVLENIKDFFWENFTKDGRDSKDFDILLRYELSRYYNHPDLKKLEKKRAKILKSGKYICNKLVLNR